MREQIIEAAEDMKRQFVGQVVSFNLRRSNGVVTREKGQVVEQRWLGRTKQGEIPEYELTILGNSGKSVLARLTEDHVVPI